MVGAADRIANQKKEREEKEAAAEIGIVALARMLDVDAALDPPGA
jgi:hypothetical protein